MSNNNYSKQEDNKINYCRICADNGFPNERIIFKNEGTKPDGSILWVLYDYSRPLERHFHKAALQEKDKPNTQVQYIDTIGPLLAEIYRILLRLIDLLEQILKKRHKPRNNWDDFDYDF